MAIKGVLVDLGGVVYVGDRPIQGAIEAIDRLNQAGLPVRFLTNTTRISKRRLVVRLTEMGLILSGNDLFTPADAARSWLKQHGMAAHLLVHPDLHEDFAGFEDGAKKAVIVGDAGDAFTYAALNAAFRQLVAGAPLLTLAKNRSFRDADDELSLDAGAFVAGLEYAAEVEGTLMGKPSPDFFSTALASMACPADRGVMIGDDAEADVAGALASGVGHAVLVRTGKYRDGDEAKATPPPTETVDDFAAAVDWVLAAQP